MSVSAAAAAAAALIIASSRYLQRTKALFSPRFRGNRGDLISSDPSVDVVLLIWLWTPVSGPVCSNPLDPPAPPPHPLQPPPCNPSGIFASVREAKRLAGRSSCFKWNKHPSESGTALVLDGVSTWRLESLNAAQIYYHL